MYQRVLKSRYQLAVSPYYGAQITDLTCTIARYKLIAKLVMSVGIFYSGLAYYRCTSGVQLPITSCFDEFLNCAATVDRPEICPFDQSLTISLRTLFPVSKFPNRRNHLTEEINFLFAFSDR